MNFDLIYIAVIIFSLLIIGLVLTVLEFKQIQNTTKATEDKQAVTNKSTRMAVDNSA